MKPITEWSSPKEIMTTQWGVITYEKWCGLEANRINTKLGSTSNVHIVHKGSRMALSR